MKGHRRQQRIAACCPLSAIFLPARYNSRMIICLGTTPTVQLTMRFNSVQHNAVNRTHCTTRTASGKAVNVARVAQTRDAQVLVMGFVGGDSGAFIRSDLEASGIAHDFVDVAPPTRTCVTVIDAADGSATELVEESKAVAPSAYTTLLDHLTRRITQANVLVLSGSMPPQAPTDFYARCVRIAQQAGAKTIVDATGPYLREATLAKPTLVKPNVSELVQTLDLPGSEASHVRQGIEQLINLGAEQVVVTAGPGAVLYGERSSAGEVRIGQVIPPAVKVVSPIGSGDAVAAGIAVSLQRGDPLEQAVRLGVVLGCANAMQPVAGMVDRDTVEQLLNTLSDPQR